ncbi:MAG: lactate racemase domain-containing protein [Chloroflexi bacterium]|nr:lactate racemase domain-containing protein [Chloroflexota bacterium]MCL5273853.1 lactate racemase domain-containing protein [Chloroflexota bacterium]
MDQQSQVALLDDIRVVAKVEQGLAGFDASGKRLLVIVPDGTRTAPLPLLIRAIYRMVGRQAKQFDVMIALGTHQAMSEAALEHHLGMSAVERAQMGNFRVMNHEWWAPGTLVQIGAVPAADARAITHDIISDDIPVVINRQALEHDHIIICGPVFPHESVGFSGGSKYLFPGIAGFDTISTFHWLNAMLTTMAVIGIEDTPVRRLIDKYVTYVQTPITCIAFVVSEQGMHAVFTGDVITAQRQAAEISAQVHIAYLDKPVHTVIAHAAERYDDLWTGGKAMFKAEPVVRDGGRVLIHAPHITEVSYTHGKWLDEAGYHVRDYFALQMERFAHIPKVALAHSTNVKGAGTFDLRTGVEAPRIQVDISTRIPRERTEHINLGYVDPATVSLEEWERRAKDDDGILFIPHAGEFLYRLKK